MKYCLKFLDKCWLMLTNSLFCSIMCTNNEGVERMENVISDFIQYVKTNRLGENSTVSKQEVAMVHAAYLSVQSHYHQNDQLEIIRICAEALVDAEITHKDSMISAMIATVYAKLKQDYEVVYFNDISFRKNIGADYRHSTTLAQRMSNSDILTKQYRIK